MSSGTKASQSLRLSRQDEILVRECLLGSEQAWSDLIEKYKNLIFSIPIKYGLSVEDAADIFQAVCLTLLQELSHIREPRALAAWLIRSTARKCFQWRRQQQVATGTQIDEAAIGGAEEPPEELMHEIEREQILRDAIAEASVECNRLINLLFLTTPPLSYDEVARTLGFAKGSIGATRMRCLEKLRLSLEKKGFR
jgi:RNA polymerase sigma factor (sigma-70 family)